MNYIEFLLSEPVICWKVAVASNFNFEIDLINLLANRWVRNMKPQVHTRNNRKHLSDFTNLPIPLATVSNY